jgi:hypothetical protein
MYLYRVVKLYVFVYGCKALCICIGLSCFMYLYRVVKLSVFVYDCKALCIYNYIKPYNPMHIHKALQPYTNT